MFFGAHIATAPALQNVNLENLPSPSPVAPPVAPPVADENFFTSLSIGKDGCHETCISMGMNELMVSLRPETLLRLPPDGSEIGVENLPLEVNETDVRTIFEEHGTIRKLTSSKDIKSTKMVLLFASPVMAENALRKNGYHFQGNYLKVYTIKTQNRFSCFFPCSWNENKFKDAINKLGPGAEEFKFGDEKDISRAAKKEATVSYFNSQCAWFSFNKIAQEEFKFGDIKPIPSWAVRSEKKQTYVEAVMKADGDLPVSVKHKQLAYACWTCGRSDFVTNLCRDKQHRLMSKEDYFILKTNKYATCSRFPIPGMDMGDFVINVDAFCGHSEIAFGVVIRRSTMEFFRNTMGGPCPKNDLTSYDAEILALEHGIQVAQATTSMGKLFIFTDCLPVETCFNTGRNISCGGTVEVDRELVNKCRISARLLPWIEAGKLGVSSKLLAPTREVEVFHIHRELNQAADAVARRATLRDSYVEDRDPIREIHDILEEDKFLYRVIKKKMICINV